MEEFNKNGRIIGILGAIVLFFAIGSFKGCMKQKIRENAINNATQEYNNR